MIIITIKKLIPFQVGFESPKSKPNEQEGDAKLPDLPRSLRRQGGGPGRQAPAKRRRRAEPIRNRSKKQPRRKRRQTVRSVQTGNGEIFVLLRRRFFGRQEDEEKESRKERGSRKETDLEHRNDQESV